MEGIDIAKFAENLLEQEAKKANPTQFSASIPSDAPDISDIEIPKNFATQVLSEGNWRQANVVVEAPAVEKATLSLNEDSLYKKHLLNEYRKKVSDLKELVTEMTTVGMIGVGAGASHMPTSISITKKRKKKKGKNNARTRRLYR